MTIFHGIKTNLLNSSSLALTAVSTAVIGLVATADDADETAFPLDTPVLVNDVRAAALKAGTTGTLLKALTAIADQCNPTVIVVRVGTDAEAQDGLVTGTAHGGYTGINALLIAKHLTGTQPRIIGAPGLESAGVLSALAVAAKALRGVAYGHLPAASKAAAIAARATYATREMMLIWPNTTTGDIAARALGLRAQIDQTTGWHKTISNVALSGVVGTDMPVTWTLDGENSDAADLNNAQITTIVNTGAGWVLWGNRTTASGEQQVYSFESATRTSQIIQDTIDEARLKYTDQPMSETLVSMIIDETKRWLRKLTVNGQLIGADVWWDAAENQSADLANGQAVFDYDFTPVAPLEGQTNNQRITDKYYADFASLALA